MYQGEYSFNDGPWTQAGKPRPTSHQAKADCKMVLEPNRAESSYYRLRVVYHLDNDSWVLWRSNPPHKRKIKWV